MRATLAFAAAAAAAPPSGVEYCYYHSSGVHAAGDGGAWDGANGGGLQVEDNSPWPGQPTPDGSYYAFIQNAGYIEQTFTASSTGLFTLSWLDAGRPSGCCAGNQHYNVLLSGLTVASFDTVTSQAFGAKTSSAFHLTGGQSYTVRFQGTRTSGDDTAFIDRVALNSAAPEPAAWALMIVGFGSAGAMLRRRRVATAA